VELFEQPFDARNTAMNVMVSTPGVTMSLEPDLGEVVYSDQGFIPHPGYSCSVSRSNYFYNLEAREYLVTIKPADDTATCKPIRGSLLDAAWSTPDPNTFRMRGLRGGLVWSEVNCGPGPITNAPDCSP
jgi:hypothetical protein